MQVILSLFLSILTLLYLLTITLCDSNGGILGSGAPLDDRVTDLVWGWSVDG